MREKLMMTVLDAACAAQRKRGRDSYRRLVRAKAKRAAAASHAYDAIEARRRMRAIGRRLHRAIALPIDYRSRPRRAALITKLRVAMARELWRTST